MSRRIPIRAKLACALAVPLAGLVGGAAFQIVEANRTVDEVRGETDLAAAAVGPGSLVSQLQNERNYTALDLIGQADAVSLPVDSLEEARAATDAAFAEMRTFLGAQGAEAMAAFSEGLATDGAALDELRSLSDEYDGPRSLANNAMGTQIFQAYSRVITTLLDNSTGLALEIDDADLRTGVQLVDLTTRLYDHRAVTLYQSISYALAGRTDQEARLDVASMIAEGDAMEQSILQLAVGRYDGFASVTMNDPFVIRQETLMRDFAAGEELDVAALLRSMDAGTGRGIQLVRSQATERLLEVSDQLVADADAERRNVIAVAGGLVAAALALTVLVSRSITRPLVSLTSQAEAMAGQHLPAAVQKVLDTPLGEDVAIPAIEPITVRTRDEVRDVAAALNTVQQSALDLAVEQAVLRRNIADSFVNMGRRNQNLLDRQLDFITDLEREEQDGDRLASLFRLDHLATRMRRNAESLLRLAGSEPQRSMTAPIDLSDVVRGALGEVEDYQRVTVRSIDQAAVSGGVGADLAHAVAELLENALSFSPPTEPVEVRGRRTPDGYVLAIADIGLGMTPDELAVANRRLAGEESFTVAPSRYLGHYVAGHLASRVGVRIELQPGPAGGLIARVDIPASLLVDAPVDPRPVQTFEPEPVVEPVDEPVPVGVVAAPESEVVGSSIDLGDPPSSFAEPTSFSAPSTTFDASQAPDAAPEPFTPGAPLPRRVPNGSGFGGLAPVAPFTPPAGGDGVDADASATTASGLVRRVPGAQHPTTDIGARLNGENGKAPLQDDRMSADAVSSFLSDFSAGVARGISEAGHNPWEDGNEPR